MSFFPNDNRILYMSDNNGDEINHIFVRNEDSSVEELTKDEGAKAMYAGWAEDDQKHGDVDLKDVIEGKKRIK